MRTTFSKIQLSFNSFQSKTDFCCHIEFNITHYGGMMAFQSQIEISLKCLKLLVFYIDNAQTS